MTKTTTIVGPLAGLILGLAAHAGAQTMPAPLTRGFLNVNAGAQPATRTFSTSGRIPVYGEEATFEAAHHVGNGPVFDINGGVNVRPNVAVAVGYTRFKADEDATSIHSSVPSPLFINRPQVQDQEVPGLNHKETSVYILGMFMVPVTEKFDVSLGIGPAFMKVKQDLVPRIEIPTNTQAAVPIVETQSKSTVGVNFTVDGAFLFTRRIGAGVFVRYMGAKADLDAVPDLKIGGFQGGAGIRVRF